MLGHHERRELGEDQVRDLVEVALALEHAGESLEVGLQPVLLDVLPRRFAEVPDHLVELVLQDGDLAARLDAHLPGEVALGDGGGHVGDGAHLVGEVRRQLVHVVGEVLPDAADFLRLRLAAELAFDTDLARDSGHLARERVELIDHRVHGVLQLEELTLHVDRDLLAEVAVGNCRGDLGDVSHLAGQVAGHEVHVVGEVLPNAADLDRDCGRLAELAFGADLARNARQLGDESVELVDHRVDRVLQLEHLAAHIGGDLLAQVAVGNRADHPLHLAGGPHEVVDEAVDRIDAAGPALGQPSEHDALGEPSLLADDLADSGELDAERLVGDDDVVQAVGDLAGDTRPVERHPGGEVAFANLGEYTEERRGVDGVGESDRGINHVVSP